MAIRYRRVMRVIPANPPPPLPGDPIPPPPPPPPPGDDGPAPTQAELDMGAASFIYRQCLARFVRRYDFENEADIQVFIRPPSGQPLTGPWFAVGNPARGIYNPATSTEVNWKKDTVYRSSGTGALLMRTPAQGGSDAAGEFALPHVDDFRDTTLRNAAYVGQGERGYIQYRWRGNPAHCSPWASSTDPHIGPKFSLWGTGRYLNGPPLYGLATDPEATSCSDIELAIQGAMLNGNTLLGSNNYVACPSVSTPYGQHGFQTEFSSPSSHIVYQNAIGSSQPTRCVYPNFVSPVPFVGSQCFTFQPNTWYTITLELILGTWGQPQSRIRIWYQKDGGPAYLIDDSQIFVINDFPADGADPNASNYRINAPIPQPGGAPDVTFLKYGLLHLLPYISNRNSNVANALGDGRCWYDEVIIAKGNLRIPDSPRKDYAIATVALAMARNELRDMSLEAVGAGSGFNNIGYTQSAGGGPIFAWSSKFPWDPVGKNLLFTGTGHNGNWHLLRYSIANHSWTKTQVPPTGIPWEHGSDQNAVSWRDGRLFVDRTTGGFPNTNTGFFPDPAGAPTNYQTLNLSGNGGSMLYPPQEWFPTMGTEGRLVRYDSDLGLQSWDPVTLAWTTHSAGFPTLPFPAANNSMFMRYHPFSDTLLFGGGGQTNRVYRFTKTGTLTEIGASGNPFTTMSFGSSVTATASCTLFASPTTNEIVFFRADFQVWVLDVTTGVWTRKSSLESTILPMNILYQTGVPPTWGLVCSSIQEYGVVAFCKASGADGDDRQKFWLWKYAG